jgi:hypothetical protein
VDGDGAREDAAADAGAPEVVDAELHAGDAAVAPRHVRPCFGITPMRHPMRHAINLSLHNALCYVSRSRPVE